MAIYYTNQSYTYYLKAFCCDSKYGTKYSKSGSSKICGRQPLENLREYGLPKNIFTGCLPQILLVPLLNALSHIFLKCLEFDNDIGRLYSIRSAFINFQ